MTEEQMRVALKALRSDPVRLLIGTEEWDLTYEEEMTLIALLKEEQPAVRPIQVITAADLPTFKK